MSWGGTEPDAWQENTAHWAETSRPITRARQCIVGSSQCRSRQLDPNLLPRPAIASRRTGSAVSGRLDASMVLQARACEPRENRLMRQISEEPMTSAISPLVVLGFPSRITDRLGLPHPMKEIRPQFHAFERRDKGKQLLLGKV